MQVMALASRFGMGTIRESVVSSQGISSKVSWMDMMMSIT